MNHPSQRRPRLEEVAERAGVTKGIASRVLNGDPTVSVRDDTRQRILVASRDLAYRPHPLARALASSGTGAIALLVPAFGNPAYTALVRGAYGRARERDYVLLAAEDFEGQEADEAFTELVEAGRLDGLLIASALPARQLLAALERHPVPHVFVNRAIPGVTANIVLDVAPASELAVGHLTELGHARLAHVAGPSEVESARRREDAFVAAAVGAGLEPTVVRGGFSERAGYESTRKLLVDKPALTAVYTSSFDQAAGALRAAADLQLRVPEELSILSFEDVTQAEYTVPRLTTIAMPMHELGQVSVDVLLEQIGGAAPRMCDVKTKPRLVQRESTAPPARSP